jgi:hypothetical protein
MKKICITFYFCFAGFSLLSQTSKIENTRAIISTSTDTMFVKYDLVGIHEAFVSLEVKDFNNRIIQPKHIYGDIGKRIKPGKDKTIIWDMNADELDLSGSSLKVKVKGDVFIPSIKKKFILKAEEKIIFKPPKWAVGLEYFTGYGILTDDLTKTYINSVPYGVGGDFYHKRLALYLRDYIGFSKTIRDVPYTGGIWANGSATRIFIPEASLGYTVAENKNIKITPFSGYALTLITPSKSKLNEVPELSQVELLTSTYLLGLNLDFKLNPPKTGGIISIYELGHGFVFIRLRYSYNITQFNKKYPGFDGNIHSITLGIGGLGTLFRAER